MRRAGGEPFQWEWLVPRLLHHMQVEIIEAMWWIGRPLAASELEEVFDRAYSLPHIDYHVRRLVRLAVVRKVRSERVRGATKNYYLLSP